MFADRVLSGMRPTGRMHLGHYHGALKNWVRLQEEYECLYFAADWHALTTHYDTPETIAESVWEMFVDWLAVGINPNRATIFIQSHVPEHAELALLLGMITPVGWLERVPTYKDQQEKLADRDLSTFGFLGYPLMHGAESGEIQRRTPFLEDFDEARHVRAFDVVGESDVHGELGDGVLHFAIRRAQRDGIAQSFHAHSLDRKLARVGQ